MKNPSYSFDPGNGVGQSGFGVGGPSILDSGFDWNLPTGKKKTSDDTSGGFDATFHSSTGGGTGDSLTDFPEWMQPDIHELTDEYAGIDQYFNLGKKVKPIRDLANAQYSQALQQGANAGNEAIARAFQTGIVGSNVNTSMISAQTALPALVGKMQAEAGIADLRINNMYREQAARGALASQIAQSRMSYVNTLANYSLGRDRLNLEAQLGYRASDRQDAQQQFLQQRYQDQQNASPTYGDLSQVMSAYNGAAGFPTALGFWQQFGAGLGDLADKPVGISFGGATNPGLATTQRGYNPYAGY